MSKDIKLIIPESWDEINLATYAKLASFEKGKTEVDNILGIISILSNVTVEELKTIPADYFEILTESINWIGVTPTIKEMSVVNIGDDKYSINQSYSKLTMGEMISIESLMEGIKDDPNNSISIVLGVLLRKVNSDGSIAKFDSDVALNQIELFREEISITDGLSLMVGFGNGENSFMKTILASSEVTK